MIQLEPITEELCHEIEPLLVEQSKEMRPGQAMNPQYEHYMQRAAIGRLYIIVAREDREISGFLLFRIDQSPYDQTWVVAEELFFIRRHLRGTTLARRMIEIFKDTARDFGATELYMGFSGRDASALYRRSGLREMAVLYGMILEPKDAQPSAA